MALIEYKGKFLNIEDQSKSVKLFTIGLDKQIEFKAGQFINLIFESGDEKYMKPYSIASTPSNKNEIQLSVKLVENGRTTPHLFKKKVGDEVTIKGPFGLFNLDKSKREKIVFIGTGTGVAPLRSMIIDLLDKDTNKELTLIFGVRHENEILFHDEFLKLVMDHPNFRYIPVVSRPTENWEGRFGHVQENFDMIDPQNSEVYICGLPVMVEESKEKLLNLGLAKEDIHLEKY